MEIPEEEDPWDRQSLEQKGYYMPPRDLADVVSEAGSYLLDPTSILPHYVEAWSSHATPPHEAFLQLPDQIQHAYMKHMALNPSIPVMPNQVIYPGEDQAQMPEQAWYQRWMDWFENPSYASQ